MSCLCPCPVHRETGATVTAFVRARCWRVSLHLGVGLRRRRRRCPTIARLPRRLPLPIVAPLVCCTVAAAGLLGASAHAADPPPVGQDYGYLSQPTEQLGIPGVAAGGQITPEGAVHTASVEVVPLLRGGRAGTRSARTMPDPQVPVYEGRPSGGGRVQWWAAPVGGVPAAVVALAPGRRGVAGMALRWSGPEPGLGGATRYRFLGPAAPQRPGLYFQPGEAFRAGACWSVASEGDAVVVRRDGSLVAALVGPAGAVRATGLATERCTTSPRRLAAALLRRASRTVHLVVPFEPLAAGDPRTPALLAADPETSRVELVRTWKATAREAVAIRLPERRVQDAVRASLVHALVPRYRLPDGSWVQAVNKLQYHAFWLRDTAVIARALDHMGLGRQAAEDLDFFSAWQSADGLFQSRPGQMDGHGQALWALGEHVALTGDVAFARRWAPRVAAAVQWLDGAAAADPLGLVPPSDPRDNELVAGHLTGDSAWAIGGLERAAGLLEAAGDPATAVRARALRDRMRARLLALLPAGRRIPPALDAEGGQDWGNLWTAWPEPVLDPADSRVGATLRSTRSRFREGISTYADGRVLHGYIGFRVWQTELRRGEQSGAVDGLYATIAHLTAAHGGFEAGVRPFSTRRTGENMAPHGWLASELLTYVRDLLVHETPDGLTFLGALPPAWTRPGALTSIRDAPTRSGPATVVLRARRSGAQLSWRVALREGATEPVLRWPVPAGARRVRVLSGPAVLADGVIRLRASAGVVRVAWDAPRVTTSLAHEVDELRREYRRRGVPAP